ncbi:MAG: type II CAAX prenyl endopeptidase Rce1 family protein [Leptolyngbyaceae cyanobacterium]
MGRGLLRRLQQYRPEKSRRLHRAIAIALVALLCCWLWGQRSTAIAQDTAPADRFTQLHTYPAKQLPTAEYLPVAVWSGRLILPDQAAAEADPMDWVWMEVYTSPDANLIGQRVRLQWLDTPENQTFLELVTRGIQFDDKAIASIELGRIHPTRLDGWAKVGPLQSLAGTRPTDDMIVALPEKGLQVDVANSAIAINAIPVQIPERFYGLVKVLGPDETQSPATHCPGAQPCPSDYQRVQHFNPITQTFDGTLETVYWPQAAPKEGGVYPSTPRGLPDSSAGEAGWYIYGARQQDGMFTVRAIAPRRLFELTPQTVITSPGPALNYINFGNWRDTPDRKGTIQSVLVSPEPTADVANWQVGDQLLVIHLFGGIGGDQAEPRSVPGTVTGHYAYGIGEVVLEPLTQTPRLQIIYNQVYSHNPQGIVAGRSLWAEYAGNLQRGWLGTRPISDVLVKIPALSQVYQFGEVTLNPFAEFQRELVVMMARYRTGDGTGAAIVTPAQSCVQDSSQALYETIQSIRNQLDTNPEVSEWLTSHPNDPQTQLFQELISLGQSLQRELVPLGIARADWHENTDVLEGIESGDRPLTSSSNPVNNLLSWRTVIPRVAYDSVATILLEHRAELWFLRTNQVGGQDPTILPLPATELFGEYVVIPTVFSRVLESLRWPRWYGWGIIILGILAVVIGEFLSRSDSSQRTHSAILPSNQSLSIKLAIKACLTPALLQELTFRVLLLPHPTEAVRPVTGMIWAITSLGLFVLYRIWRSRSPSQAFSPSYTFQICKALGFGLVAMVVYFSTGSLWAAATYHWGLWLWERLPANSPPKALLVK